MMNKFKKLILSLIIFSVIFLPAILSFNLVEAASITERMKTAIETVDLPGTEPGGNIETRTQAIVGLIINAFLSLFGIIFMILILYGGYKWMLAAGREEELTKAKDIIRSAIIGLIIVMAAYAISYFIALALETATVN